MPWEIDGVTFVACATIQQAEQHAVSETKTQLVVANSAAEFLQELVHPTLCDWAASLRNVCIAKTMGGKISCEFMGHTLVADKCDILKDGGKLCDACFRKGIVKLLKNCVPHKPSKKRCLEEMIDTTVTVQQG
jgi:hypothetical protein